MIRIIVRARNEIAGVLDRAAGDVDKLTQAQKRGETAEKRRAVATKNTGKAVEDATKRFDSYTRELEKGTKSGEAAEKQLKSFQREFDRLGNRVQAGTQAADTLYQLGRRAEGLAAQVKKANLEVADSSKKTAQVDVKAADDRVAAQKRLEAAISRTVRTQQKARTDSERAAATSKVSGLVRDLRELGVEEERVRKVLRTSTVDAGEDVALTRRQKRINELIDSQRRLRDMPPPAQGFLSRFLGIDSERLSSINKSLRDFEQNANSGGFSAVRLAGNLRGMVIVGAIGFFQQLAGVGIALAGTLVSIAGAAIQAGAALGGALVAGAAQAIPVIGLLGAAWGRVGAVFDALKQAQKARLSASFDEKNVADRQRAAADSVRNAQEALASAQRNATVAQENLTKARADGRREIEDLILAEKRAQLQAEGAALSQEESQRALRRAIATGDVASLARRSLEARSSNVDLLGASITGARATFDATKARRGGVEGLDSVKAAQRAVQDAQRSIASATRGLSEAQRQAGDAASSIGTADRLLQQLLADLSPAERRLFTVMQRVQKRYKEVFRGPGGVLESIIDAFTHAAERIDGILKDKRFITAAKSLADGIAGQLRRLTDFFTSKKNLAFFEEMGREAKRNLPIVVSILENVFDLLRNIARAGAPAFHAFLNFLKDLTGQADAATSSNGGISKLQVFFSKGEKYAESFIKLGLAIAGLFLALTGTSADEGQNSIDALTGKIQEATAWINTHQEDVRQFFKEARVATFQIMKMLFELSKLLFSLFKPGQVGTFADAFRKTLLPALIDILQVLGLIAHIFLVITASDITGPFVQLGLVSLALYKVLHPLFTIGGKLAIVFGTLSRNSRLVAGALVFLKRGLGPFTLAFSVISGTLLLLHGRIHDVGDALKILGSIASGLLLAFVGRAGLTAALLGVAAALERIGLAGAGLKLIGIGGAIGSFASKVPILGRLLGGGKAAAAATTAAEGTGGAVAAAEGAGGAAAIAKIGLGALIKKAGWIGLGVTAGQGIVEGLRTGSVSKGFREFFHSATFGLVDSAEEAASKAAKRINDRLGQGTLQLGTTGVKRFIGSPKAGGGILPEQTKDQRDFDRLSDTQKKAVTTIRSLQTEFSRLAHTSSRFIDFSSFFKRLNDFARTAPPEFAGALDKLIGAAREKRKELNDIWRPIELGKQFGVGLLEGLQQGKSLDKVVDTFMEKIRPLSKETKHVAVRSMISMAEGLEEKGKLPRGAAKRLREDILDSYEQMRRRAARKGEQLAENQAAAMSNLSTATSVQISNMFKLVNDALKSLGVDPIKAPRARSSPGASLGGGSPFGPLKPFLSTGGSAEGGWIGKQGERGGDFIPRWLGRGEAVLNWAHQKVVDPALKMAYGFGLDGLFKRTRGAHGWEMPGYGDARGRLGTMKDATNIDVKGSKPGFKAFMEFFRRLTGDSGIYVESGLRPGAVVLGTNRASNHAAGNAIDITNAASVHGTKAHPPPRNSLDALFPWIKSHIPQPPRLDALWRTMTGGNHFQHLHLGLSPTVTANIATARRYLAAFERSATAIGASISGGATAAAANIPTLKAPKVPGGGPLSRMTQRLLDRAYAAANTRLIGSSGDTTPSVGKKGQKGVVGRAAAALGIPAKYLWGVYGAETGFGSNVTTSGAGAQGPFQFMPATADSYIVGGRRYIQDFTKSAYGAARYLRHLFKIFKSWPSAIGHYNSGEAGSLTNSETAAYIPKVLQLARQYAMGGAVPGFGGGDKHLAALEGGEHVWTKDEVARAGGHGMMRMLRKMLGGGGQGGPTGYAAGGAYVEPILRPTNVQGNITEAAVLQRIIASLSGRTTPKYTDKLTKAFTALLGDKDGGGILEQLAESIQRLSDKLSLNLRKATFKIDKAGNAVRKLDEVGVADRTLKNLQTVYTNLLAEQLVVEKSLADLAHKLKAKGLSKTERAVLVGLQRRLNASLAEIQTAVADSVEAQFQAAEDAINARVTKGEQKASTANTLIDIIQRGRDLIGGTILTAFGVPDNEQMGLMRAAVLKEQAKTVLDAAQRAKAQGHPELAAQLMAQAQSLGVAAIEAVRDGIAKDVDELERQAGRRTAALDIKARIASALGRLDDLGPIAQERVGDIGRQIDDLKGKQAKAIAGGFFALAEEIGDKIKDLQATAVEVTAQALNDAVDRVNTAAQRRTQGFDLRDRLSNLRQSAGDFAGAFQERDQTLRGRGASIQSQRDQLNNLLTIAALEGNTGQVNSLTDQIAELDVQLQENVAAIKENTVQARQAALDRILGRGQFLGGVFGGLQGILTSLGTLSGSNNLAQINALLQKAGETLQEVGSQLADQLSKYGISISGLTPESIVQVLSNINFDSIERGMTESQRTTFENLINAVISNAQATVDNTLQLKQLNGEQVQSFSTTAWQLFRQAIFTGSGGLLPQFNIPQMDTGGVISKSGLFGLHAGERVLTSKETREYHTNGDTHIHVTNPVAELDVGYVAQALAYHRTLERAN